jgi:hypothetical protein
MNAHLSKTYGLKNHIKANERGQIIQEFMSERRLISVTSQGDAIGPNYSYSAHNGEQTTLIDHVLVAEDKLDFVKTTGIIEDHCLNCSDHFPIFINISVDEHLPISSRISEKTSGVNWKKSIQRPNNSFETL